MKRQTFFLLLLLLFTLFLYCGCGSSNDTAAPETAAPLAKIAAAEESAPAYQSSDDAETLEDTSLQGVVLSEDANEEMASDSPEMIRVTGTFQGLEDNHTAIFSFDGVESTFYFETEEVQNVLYGAVLDSSYTFSYQFDDGLQLNVIYEISE